MSQVPGTVVPPPPAAPPAPTPTSAPPAPPIPPWASGVPQKHVRATLEETLAEVAKANVALESLVGDAAARKAAAEAPKPPASTPPANPLDITTPKAAPALDDDAGMEEYLAAAGLKIEDTTAAWQEKQELTPEQYAALKKTHGLSRKMVDDFIRNQVGVQTYAQQQATQTCVQLAGGQTQFETLIAFGKSMPDGPAKADLQRRLANTATVEGAFKQLMFEHAQAVGAAGSVPLVSGQPASGATGSPFNNQAEIRAAQIESAAKFDGNAMNDPAFMARMTATQKLRPHLLKNPLG